MPSQFVLDEGILGTDLLGPVVIVSALAEFGGGSSSANTLVTHLATMSAPLGSLSANARAADNIDAVADAQLGNLDAVANTIPVTPTIAGGGGMPNFVQPNFPQPETKQEVQVSTIIADAVANLGMVKSTAVAEIAFSILEDDAEVLLLI